MQNVKRTVMHISHALRKQGRNKSEALRQAWALVKNGIVAKAKGVTYGRRQEALERLTRYSKDMIRVSLERENNGYYFCVMVEVIGKGSYCIGYMAEEISEILMHLVQKGIAPAATFEGVIGGMVNAWFERLKYGATIKVAFAS